MYEKVNNIQVFTYRYPRVHTGIFINVQTSMYIMYAVFIEILTKYMYTIWSFHMHVTNTVEYVHGYINVCV